jgi:hypothetical protein
MSKSKWPKNKRRRRRRRSADPVMDRRHRF